MARVKTLENPADKPSQPAYLQAVRSPTTIALIVANLVPLVGVLFFDWSLFTIMFIFWMESAVIGCFNVLKLVIVANILSIIMVPFFVVHYGAFMSGHLVFIFALFSPDERSFSGLLPPLDLLTSQVMNVWPAFLAVSLSHGISFFLQLHWEKRVPPFHPRKTNDGSLWTDHSDAPHHHFRRMAHPCPGSSHPGAGFVDRIEDRLRCTCPW